MDIKRKNELMLTAAKLRKEALDMVYTAKSGHIGGALSAADIITVLVFEKMRTDPKNPLWEDRDRLVLSKGHASPLFYAALAYKGFFPIGDLKTFRHVDSYLSGHVEMRHVPGVDMSSGSLGQGLSVGLGMALSAKLSGKNYRTFVITGDGELQEGQNWEAAMAAAYYKADNLTVIVDRNHLQLEGPIEEVMGMGSIPDKFRAFGFEVIEIDGHDICAISDAVDKASSIKGRPTVIIAETVKGKGVSFMENNPKFHGAAPNDEQYQIGAEELDKMIRELNANI